jgi:tetratricopeptide (TPR) repeat protein
LAQAALGEAEQAKAAFEKAASASEGGASEAQYYKGRALQKLGRNEEATPLFERLIKQDLADLERSSEAVDYFAKFGERRAERLRLAQAQYLTGLGYWGQQQGEEAASRFHKALGLNPAHLGALTVIRELH